MSLHLPLAPKVLFEIAGISITETVFYSWIIMAIIIIAAIIFRIAVEKAYAKNNQIPVGAANVAEIIVGGVNDFAKDNIHHHWKPFAPYIATIGIFLALSNTMGMYGFKIAPITRDFNLPFALATITIFLVIFATIYYKGFWGFVKSFFQPVWWLFPLKIIEIFARWISLTARLFGNILAAFIIMELLIQTLTWVFGKIFIGPGIPAVFSLYFDIFDGLLQALVFTFLTTLYIEEGLEEA